MTRTISVVFNDDYKLNTGCDKQPKRYKFLCNYDVVRVGDKIRDPRYTSIMTVVEISNSNKRVQEGITLKEINITHINGVIAIQPSGLVNGVKIGSDFDIDKQRYNNMEKEKHKSNIGTGNLNGITVIMKHCEHWLLQHILKKKLTLFLKYNEQISKRLFND